MNKYIAKFNGIAKTVYAYNLEQAFQEANIFGTKRNIQLHSIEDTEEFVSNPPYFGIYDKKPI